MKKFMKKIISISTSVIEIGCAAVLTLAVFDSKISERDLLLVMGLLLLSFRIEDE